MHWPTLFSTTSQLLLGVSSPNTQTACFVLVSHCVSWIKAAQKFSTSNRMNKLKFSSFCFRHFTNQRLVVVWSATAMLLTTLGQALGQPTIVSTAPASGATGISSNGSVVFTF